MVPPTGFEPAAPRLGIWCSIQLSYGGTRSVGGLKIDGPSVLHKGKNRRPAGQQLAPAQVPPVPPGTGIRPPRRPPGRPVARPRRRCPPVANRSSTMTTRSPAVRLSAWTSKAASPYSRAYLTLMVVPGSLPALRIRTSGRSCWRASGAPKTNPRDSTAPSLSIPDQPQQAFGQSGHGAGKGRRIFHDGRDVAEQDAGLGEVGDRADGGADGLPVVHATSPG